MMLEKYRKGVAGVDRVTASLVLKQLRLSWRRRGVDALFRTLDEAGHDQADLVLCLLRVNTREALRSAEKLVGKKITRCPPCLQRYRAVPLRDLRLRPHDTSADERRVLSVVGEPTLRSGRKPWLRRWHLFQVGLSVSQLLRRGVTRRDLRLVTKRGWVRLSA